MPFAELSPAHDLIHISTTYADQPLMLQLSGARYVKKAETWAAPLSWGTCVTLRGLFGTKLTTGPKLNQWAWQLHTQKIAPALRMRYELEPVDAQMTGPQIEALLLLDKIEAGQTLKLYPFQRVDVAFMVAGRRALLCNEPGLGKTGSVIRTLQVLAALGEDPFPAIVICPNSLKRTVWKRELAAWAPELSVSIVDGSAAVRRKALAAGAQVTIINWESTWRHSRLAPYGDIHLTDAEKAPKELNAINPTTVIVDEVHRGKNPQTKQTRAVWAVAHQAVNRIAMTGTPVGNHVAEAWPLLHLVEPTSFPAKTRWMDRYITQAPNFYGGATVLGLKPETKDELFQMVDPLFRRAPKELALPQLPPKLPIEYRETPMTVPQRKAYNQMRDLMVAELNDIVTAGNGLTKLVRLSQFACAFAELGEPYEVRRRVKLTKEQFGAYLDPDAAPEHYDGHIAHWITAGVITGTKNGFAVKADGLYITTTEMRQDVNLKLPSSKVDDLVELLDDMGDKPLVVGAVSRQLIELAAAKLTSLGITNTLVTGAQSTEERDRNVQRFQNGEVRVILCTLGAGAEGITLTRADTLLFMQRSWSLLQNKQFEDRVHRIGSEGHECIRIIEQIAPETVDELRILTLAGKDEQASSFVRDYEMMAQLLGTSTAKGK